MTTSMQYLNIRDEGAKLIIQKCCIYAYKANCKQNCLTFNKRNCLVVQTTYLLSSTNSNSRKCPSVTIFESKTKFKT